MWGQFHVEVRNATGDVTGTGALHIDKGAKEGHLTYSQGSPLSYVGKCSIAEDGATRVRITVSPDTEYESAYGVEPQCRMDPTYMATATLAKVEGDAWEGHWEDLTGSGTVELVHMASEMVATPLERFDEWAQFKEWADRYTGSGCAFRGQAYPRLTSTFHRTGRVDLVRYVREDLPHFIDYLETLTGRSYDVRRPDDFGAVLALAQHHGFPTPLLDWTLSPYVAAYFAYCQIVERTEDPDDYVRIYRLDSTFVQHGLRAGDTKILSTHNQVVAFRPTSKGNARLLNQQGLFTLTNVADVETWLRYQYDRKDGAKTPQLSVVEVKKRAAAKAIADLRNMGTTAATLFPGLDGASTYLKHLRFYAP